MEDSQLSSQLKSLEPMEPSDSSDYVSTDFDSEIESDFSLYEEEGFMDRVMALKDIIPPQARYQLSEKTSWLVKLGLATFNLLGKTAWVLSTTGLVMVVPLLFELDKETQLMLYEKEQKLREQTAQQMLYPATGSTNTPTLPSSKSN